MLRVRKHRFFLFFLLQSEQSSGINIFNGMTRPKVDGLIKFSSFIILYYIYYTDAFINISILQILKIYNNTLYFKKINTSFSGLEQN